MQLDLFNEQRDISLYPSMASIKEAREYIFNRLPITDENELYSLLMMYRNTLLDRRQPVGSLPGAL